jgi:hypothetical protein
MVSDIPTPLYVEEWDLHLLQYFWRGNQMRSVSTSSQSDHMGMLKDKKHICEFVAHPPRPELMLELPGLLVIHYTEI